MVVEKVTQEGYKNFIEGLGCFFPYDNLNMLQR